MTTHHDRDQAGTSGEDPRLVRAWRQASGEQPPARLDDAILDAARRSVAVADEGASTRRVQPRPRNRWMQWQPIAAAATVAGLAFVLLQTLPRDSDVEPPIRIQVPAPSPERQAVPEVHSGAPEAARAPDISPDSQSGAPASGVTAAPPVPGTSPPLRQRSEEGAARSLPGEAADVSEAMRPAGTDQRKGVMTEMAGEAYSPEAAAPATDEPPATRALGIASPPSATDWAKRIETLHASGDLAAAAAALREFRAVDPDADARLPESLREWAQTVE
jgi:hypothetical protein